MMKLKEIHLISGKILYINYPSTSSFVGKYYLVCSGAQVMEKIKTDQIEKFVFENV